MADSNSSVPLCDRLLELAADVGSCQRATLSIIDVGGGGSVNEQSILWLVESKLRQVNEALESIANKASKDIAP